VYKLEVSLQVRSKYTS